MIKHLILLKIQNMMDIRVLASLVYKFFNEKNSGGSIKDSNMPGQ